MKKYFLIMLFIFAVLLGTGNTLWADDIVAKLATDSLSKPQGSTVTILYTVENHTNYFWTPVVWQAPYYFEVFDIMDPLGNGGQVGQGELIYTQEQYVGPNSSAAFAVGTFRLGSNTSNLPPGFYRILLYGPQFRNNATGALTNLSASTAIRIEAPPSKK